MSTTHDKEKKRDIQHFIKEFEKDPIGEEQVAEGMHRCFCNAKELFQEAEILLRRKRYARGFCLLVLCLEELAKPPLLLNALFIEPGDKVTWRNFWKVFRSHEEKQTVWPAYGRIHEKLKTPVAKYYQDRYPQGLVPLLEKFKQSGFYVSFFQGKFLLPNEVIPNIEYNHRKLVDVVFDMARKLLERFETLHGTRERSREMVKKSLLLTNDGTKKLVGEVFKKERKVATAR